MQDRQRWYTQICTNCRCIRRYVMKDCETHKEFWYKDGMMYTVYAHVYRSRRNRIIRITARYYGPITDPRVFA